MTNRTRKYCRQCDRARPYLTKIFNKQPYLEKSNKCRKEACTNRLISSLEKALRVGGGRAKDGLLGVAGLHPLHSELKMYLDPCIRLHVYMYLLQLPDFFCPLKYEADLRLVYISLNGHQFVFLSFMIKAFVFKGKREGVAKTIGGGSFLAPKT